MNNVALTSLEAYRKHVLSGRATGHKVTIMDLLIDMDRPMTRHEISLHTGIALQSVCSATKALLDGGYVMVAFEGPDPVTCSDPVQFVAPVCAKWEQRLMFTAGMFA